MKKMMIMAAACLMAVAAFAAQCAGGICHPCQRTVAIVLAVGI